MKKRSIALWAIVLSLASGCKDYLDVNKSPNGPETVSANMYVAPMLHWLVTSPPMDGRYVGMYTQQWVSTSTAATRGYFTWGRMGYDAGLDDGGDQWRAVYWSFGQNLVDMMTKAQDEQRWDILGLGYLLKSWGWMALTDLHGEIIIKEAFDQSRFTFDYDTQEYAYTEVLRLADSSIAYLKRTDGADLDASYLGRTDRIYAGDRTKWLKLAYGLRAIAKNHLSNKSTYNADEIISDVDNSLSGNADDPLLAYTANDPAFNDYNFFGRSRNNHTNYRQTEFMVNLMNGTDFGGVVDPRMSRMLAPAPDGQYRGLNINSNTFGALTTAQQPNNFFGYAGTAGLGLPSRYIFDDKSKIPAITTYSILQFVKAEAAFRKGDKATALAAYKNGISAHIDFVNARNQDAGQTPTQITSTEKAAFLADTNIVPTDPAKLTLSKIMMQKFIALFGWGTNEAWMDMRRYHYTDLDPATGQQVYLGFVPPAPLYVDNGGKLVWRIRPRYNSDYVWNRPGLDAIGGLALDYHTKEPWIFQP